MLPGDEYRLGGQTGSLIPDCDLAPLSGQGQSVPAGDALAVIYAGECGELPIAGGVALTGPDERPIALTLEPLGNGRAYLVRTEESLAGGRYEIELPGGQSRSVEVAPEVAALPRSLGTVTASEQNAGCPDSLMFELALGVEALAHAPLMRWYVSIDGRDPQLWIDYGALDLSAGDGRALLRLPRCSWGCLKNGQHSLSMQAEVAGESLSSDSLETRFYLDCPVAARSAEPQSTAPASSCQFGLAKARASFVELMGFLAAIVLLARARRRRRLDSV